MRSAYSLSITHLRLTLPLGNVAVGIYVCVCVFVRACVHVCASVPVCVRVCACMNGPLWSMCPSVSLLNDVFD
jgi:hypothetical protein